MPSGAKKRKAARKKKENQSNNNTSSSSSPTHPHGDDYMKHHEDRDSDVGEHSSPTSQDHQNLPTGEEEEVIPIEREFNVDELDKSHGIISDPNECLRQANCAQSKSLDNEPTASADNGADHMKDSVVTQPLLAPPLPVQKTSWKSCCGLFELISRPSV